MINEEVPREPLALGTAAPHLGMTVVGEGSEASVTTKRHIKGNESIPIGRPPLFHGGDDAGFTTALFELGDDSYYGDFWGDLISDA